jgi:hypothetical protein
MADGLTFIIQSNSPTALGPTGGGLAYGPDTPGSSGGIPNSIAVKFDLFSNAGEGNDSTGLYIDGASPTVPAIDMTASGVNLQSSDPMAVTLSYDGSTLTERVTDTFTHATFTHSYTGVNIPAIVGSNVAYVGFGGGSGGLTSVQDILAWKYTTQDPASGGGGSGSAAAATAPATSAVTVLGPMTSAAPSSPAGTKSAATAIPSARSSTSAAPLIMTTVADGSTSAVDQVLGSYLNGSAKRRKGARNPVLSF